MVYEQQNPGRAVSKQSGFSLIEVVLTLVILGLLMGLVTTNLRGAGVRNIIKAERGQLALLVEDMRTISLYANRDLSLQAYLDVAAEGQANSLYAHGPSTTEEARERRRLLAERLVIETDLLVRPPGACSTSTGRFNLSDGTILNFTVAALSCEVRLG